jgi:hypothetical protein
MRPDALHVFVVSWGRLPPQRKLLRRLEQIALLPAHEQAVLLKTIDTFLKGAQKAA